jgi:hypothetical protein
MVATARAEGERDDRRGCERCGARERARAAARAARPATSERRGVELGGEPCVEPRGHRARQRTFAEARERALHGCQLVRGRVAFEAVVVHLR